MNTEITRDIINIQNAIQHQRFILFIGTGVSCNSGVPDWRTLTSALDAADISPDKSDPLKIAQYYRDYYGEKEYSEIVRRTLNIDNVCPNPIHEALFNLTPHHIITTNYDTLLEQYIETTDKQFAVVRRDKDLPYVGQLHTLVKMHGDFMHGNFVLSENDYYNYSRNFPLTRAYVQSLFASNLVLFVGFSFADINLKYIINEILQFLQEDMQPVYFLTGEKVNHATFEYYYKKKIHILSIQREDILDITKSSDIQLKRPSKPITDERGNLMYEQLCLIKQYHPSRSLIDEIISFIELTQDEMVAFADGMKYIIPAKEKGTWNLHSDGLQIYSKSIKELSTKLKTVAGKKAFIGSYGKNIPVLRYFAYCNGLSEIDDLTILTDTYIKKIEKYDSLEQYYHLDLPELNKTLKALHGNLKNTLADLEEPYIMVLLGDYLGAFEKYDQLASHMLNQKKYIIRFFCYYNMHQLRSRIMNYLWNLDYQDEETRTKYNEIFDRIDLEELIMTMPIDCRVKKILRDIVSSNFQSSNWRLESDLRDKLADQRKSSENGGWSVNSHAALLIGRKNRFAFFYQKNFILSCNDVYAYQFYQKYVEGLLESLSTKSVQYGSRPYESSRITSLNSAEICNMVFHLSSKDLIQSFTRTRFETLSICNDGIKYLERLFENATAEIKKQMPFYQFVDKSIVINILQNMLVICSYVKEEQLTFNMIPTVLFLLRSKANLKLFKFSKIIRLQKPNSTDSKEILTYLLYNYARYGIDEELCRYLSKVMQTDSIFLNEILSLNHLLELTKDITVLGAVASVLPAPIKNEVIDYIRKSPTNLQDLLIVELNDKLNVLDKSCAEHLIDKYVKNPNQHIYVCQMLAVVMNDERYSNLHEHISKKFSKDNCFKFYLNPFDFLDSDNIDPLWICCLHEEKDVERFLKKEIHRKAVKKYVTEDNNYGHWYKNRIWNLL